MRDVCGAAAAAAAVAPGAAVFSRKGATSTSTTACQDAAAATDLQPPHNSGHSSSDTATATPTALMDRKEVKLIECFVDGCHEVVELDEMIYHLDLHAALDYQRKADEQDRAERAMRADVQARPRTGSGMFDRKRGTRHSHRRQTSSSSVQSPLSPLSPRSPRMPKAPKSPKTPKSPMQRHRPSTCTSDNSHHRERRDQERSHARREQEVSRNSRGHRHKHSHDRPTSHESRAKDSRPSTRPNTSAPAGAQTKASRSRWWSLLFQSEAKRTQQAAAPAVAAAAGPHKTRKRLGRAELGKYAHEDRMPEWLATYLKKEWGVCHSGIIPVLNQLLEQSTTTAYAYLCDPCVKHVSRLPKEGGFCGYRNIQTVVSYVMGAKFPGHNLFGEDIPSIFDIQNIIENAWDMGINAQGRVETGGIRWTRKYIGTPEAMALFRSLNIPCNAQAFNHAKTGRAADMLVREVERYFQMGKPLRPGNKIRATSLPPIYWQHPGHSLTIVGLEKTITGQTNLLVFDPVFRHGWPALRLPALRPDGQLPEKVLKLYRRGPRYMYKYRAFEILKLDPKLEDLRPDVRPAGH